MTVISDELNRYCSKNCVLKKGDCPTGDDREDCDFFKDKRDLLEEIAGDNPIAFFDGGHGRVGVIAIHDKEVCCVCEKTEKCIGIDASEGEYKTGFVCLNCLRTITV